MLLTCSFYRHFQLIVIVMFWLAFKIIFYEKTDFLIGITQNYKLLTDKPQLYCILNAFSPKEQLKIETKRYFKKISDLTRVNMQAHIIYLKGVYDCMYYQ